MEMIKSSVSQKHNKWSAIVLLLFLSVELSGCAAHTKEILVGFLAGGAVGAGLGYTVVHHGKHNEYEVQNTIITSSVVALLTAGVLAYHYETLDEQKVEITSKFSRNWLQTQEQPATAAAANAHPTAAIENEFVPQKESIGRSSVKLDGETRWVYPTFRKRFLQPENNGTEIISSRYSWEIVRPGFFVTREQDPNYFDESSSSPIQEATPSTLAPIKAPAPETTRKPGVQK